MKIGIFDSGIGGLTVLKKIIKKHPNCEYIYYGDIANMPFGDKNVDELKVISNRIIEFLMSKDVDIIVIACGTISSNLSDYLKRKYSIPIYDVISVTINYINNSNYNNIGVLCTKNTRNSGVFEKKVNKKINVISCNKLASLIEYNDLNVKSYIKKKLTKLKNSDLIVLGCTHYSIIRKKIEKYLNCRILDMSDYVNFRVNDNNNIFNLELYFSKTTPLLLNNVRNILKDYNYIIKSK